MTVKRPSRDVSGGRKPCLLVVEDDIGLQKQLKWSLDEYEPVFASTRQEALAALRKFEPVVVLQDLGLPPEPEDVREGLDTIREILALSPHVKLIVLTGNGDRRSALEAVRLGAHDFFHKPLDVEVLRLILARAFRMYALEQDVRRLASASAPPMAQGLIAADENMQRLWRTVEKIAPVDVSVLIMGESGTGKELLARAMHNLGSRSKSRFVAINCAAIPENLLASELFGHERGSFTGAHKTTPGKIEVANGGTLFLDEIGDMPGALQATLLRFLQERVIERVGGREEIPVDVRVVCATNKDLESLTAGGQFRPDLYYRISEVTLKVPPLRDRVGDATLLARYFLQRYSEEFSARVLGLSPEAIDAIESYDWPGNVRELEGKIKAAVIMAEGPLLTPAELGLRDGSGKGPLMNLREARELAERQAVLQALTTSGGNLSKAAELLGIARPTLYDLMARLKLGRSSIEDS
jgi:two-component system NtrC family response regulator